VKKVRDLMRTEIVTLNLGDALDIASDIMSLGRIRHLPVVDASQRVVGIVTQRDLLKASISSVLGLGTKREREWLGKVPVREVMTSSVVTTVPGAPVADAVEQMIHGKLGCLPVCEEGKLVGLLTETDCLRLLRDVLAPRH
jgi:CBS domain-containing membrane protein